MWQQLTATLTRAPSRRQRIVRIRGEEGLVDVVADLPADPHRMRLAPGAAGSTFDPQDRTTATAPVTRARSAHRRGYVECGF